MGHTSKACTQEKMDDPAAISIVCSNCNEEGHRIRDCPTERQRRGAPKDCRRCGEGRPRSVLYRLIVLMFTVGHMAKDCPNADTGGGGGRACHNCGEEGHMSKDCTEPRKIVCRNCEKEGHLSKDCEEPKNPTNAKCRNCDEGNALDFAQP